MGSEARSVWSCSCIGLSDVIQIFEILASQIGLALSGWTWRHEASRTARPTRRIIYPTLAMVLLTVSPATKAAIDKYCSAIEEDGRDAHEHESDPLPLSKLEIGSPIEHRDLIALSNYLVKRLATTQDAKQVNDIRLDSLLKGAKTYQPPPPPKKEPVGLTTFDVISHADSDSRPPNTRLLCDA